jgi:MoxR-like ATPase
MELSEIQEKLAQVREEVEQVIVGLDEVVDALLVALLSQGHVLLEGLPGLGKTTLAKTFAHAVGGKFKRIQMTPDLLPADVLGVNVYDQRDATWNLRKGPVFANVVLADELNRASPKMQSAFLEAMQERQVTIEGKTLPMKLPFMVIATQIPYGEAGTYPLTSVQVDRFAYKVSLDYPSVEDEVKIISRIDEIEQANLDPVLQPQEVMELMEQAGSLYVHSKVRRYIVNLVSKLRGNRQVRAGPSPRASIWLLKGARVRAMMEGREYVIPDDVKALALDALRHRVELSPQAEIDEVSVESLVFEALEATAVPKGLERVQAQPLSTSVPKRLKRVQAEPLASIPEWK